MINALYYTPRGYAIILKSDGTRETVEYNGKFSVGKKLIGCELGDFVYSTLEGLENIEILIDDEGLLRGDAVVNREASILSGFHLGRGPKLVNDVLIAAFMETLDGKMTVPLTKEQVDQIYDVLDKNKNVPISKNVPAPTFGFVPCFF